MGQAVVFVKKVLKCPIYSAHHMKKETLIPILFFLFLLAGWQASVLVFDVKEYLLPGPLDIGNKFSDRYDILIKHALVTLIEAISGFVLGVIIALIIALAITHIRIAGLMLFPLIILIHTTPKIAIAPFLAIWLGFGMASKVVISAILVFFPVVINTVRGLNSADAELFDLMRSYGTNAMEMLLKVRLPSSIPYVFSSFRIAAPASVIGAVVGEFVGSDSGLGYLILLANTNFDTSLMFASLILLAAMGICFFYLVVLIEKRILYWDIDKMVLLNNR